MELENEFGQCQLVFSVLQAQKLNYPSHVTCILLFKFLQLSKFYLSIFQSLSCILKLTSLFLTMSSSLYSVASSKIELLKSRDVVLTILPLSKFKILYI